MKKNRQSLKLFKEFATVHAKRLLFSGYNGVKHTLFIFLLGVHIHVNAQEITHFGQYMYNKPLYNPAAYGSGLTQFNLHLVTNISWIGIEGAPQSHALWSDYRLNAYRMAMGVLIQQTRLGSRENLDINFNYAYHLKINHKTQLGMGLSAGLLNAKFASATVDRYWDGNDNVFEGAGFSIMLPKFGFGLLLYQKRYYVSISCPDLVLVDRQNVIYSPDNNFFSQKRSYLLMSGTTLRISDQYAFQPHLYIYYHPLYGARIDVTSLFDITDYFWVGGTYSTSHQHRAIVGTNMSARMRFGYAFGFTAGSHADTRALSSHELNLMIRADNLFKKQPK